MASPTLSVIVPTRDRCESVLRLLRALAVQQNAGAFEVVVVDDGSSDRTADRLRAVPWPFELHVLEQPPSGPSAARNCGAALASADILLFLDDDVEPYPDVVRTHAEFHAQALAEGRRAAGLGYLPPVPPSGLLGTTLRGWWESMFDGPRRPGHRHTFRDFLTGHVSMRRADFEALGGFDSTLRCHEDWELGYRAIEAGLEFVFLPGAVASHYETANLEKVLRRKFDEGAADVVLARRIPELIPNLPLGWRGPGVTGTSRLARMAFDRPELADRLMRAFALTLPVFERWRLRFRWRALLERLLTYWYWRGVAAELKSPDAFESLLASARPPAPPEIVLDLANGVPAAAARLNAERPRSVRLTFGAETIGVLEDRPGAEPLRGAHLVAALAGPLSRPFATALARQGVMPPAIAGTLLSRTSEAAPSASAAPALTGTAV